MAGAERLGEFNTQWVPVNLTLEPCRPPTYNRRPTEQDQKEHDHGQSRGQGKDGA